MDACGKTYRVMSFNDATVREIRAEMARQQMTGSRLAAALGWSPMRLSRRLTGEVSLALAEIEQIAQVLDVPAGMFLGDGQV